MSGFTGWLPAVWMETFAELLDEGDELDYGDQWTLGFNYSQTDQVTEEERRRGWKVLNYCARAKFHCEFCHNSWSSARVVVVFRYRLRSNANRGTVIMRPFGQMCRRCRHDYFEMPSFHENEVVKGLRRLFVKIRKNCYGENEDDGGLPSSSRVWSKPHETSLCEGCMEGICCQDD